MGRTTAVARRMSRARIAVLGAVLAGALAMLAAPAVHAESLKKEFSVFQHCPIHNPEVTACVYSTTNTGEFHIGSSTVPINKTVVLQGGLKEGSPVIVPPEGAEELSRTPLEVPGGITGVALLGNLNEVFATAIPTGPIESFVPNFGKREGTAVALPFKVKLDNPSLGESCYIGSDEEPAVLHLTTGTTSPPAGTEPITGSSGELQIIGHGKINVFANNLLVDNTFAAPGTNGCAGSLAPVVDASINLKEGLPSEAGKNTARMGGTLEQTTPTAVIRQNEIPQIGRCVKVPAEIVEKVRTYHGLYINSGCTYETTLRLGKYEWEPGPGPNKGFSGSGKAATLETVGGSKISCLESTNSGEYTGQKTATISLRFTGCKRALGSEPCNSTGAPSGEIDTASLAANLGFIEETSNEGVLTDVVGWQLSHSPAIISGECGVSKEALSVSGSVIAPVAVVNKMGSGNSLKLKASGGHQIPEAFEEAPTAVLSETLGGGGAEQAGLTTLEKITNQEKLEIKAAAE